MCIGPSRSQFHIVPNTSLMPDSGNMLQHALPSFHTACTPHTFTPHADPIPSHRMPFPSLHSACPANSKRRCKSSGCPNVGGLHLKSRLLSQIHGTCPANAAPIIVSAWTATGRPWNTVHPWSSRKRRYCRCPNPRAPWLQTRIPRSPCTVAGALPEVDGPNLLSSGSVFRCTRG